MSNKFEVEPRDDTLSRIAGELRGPESGNSSQQADPDTPYAGLTPERVLDAVEALGFAVDGRLMALNSYENRVYRVGLEPGALTPRAPQVLTHAVVVKFYRQARWTPAQIREELHFALELAAAELPVAAPIVSGGQALNWLGSQPYAVFECWPGSAPELDRVGHRTLLGRTLGRMHRLGAIGSFQTRTAVSDWHMGRRARQQVLGSHLLPSQYAARYAEVSARLIDVATDRVAGSGTLRQLRIHGDCHAGNILWNDQGPLFVDFDDCLTGPAVQDLWMHCSGTPDQMQREWTDLLDGYEQFAHFEVAEMVWMEALRAIRMLNHTAWLCTRWHDPAFPRAFPWFGESRFWERHMDELQEQCEAVEDPPLLRLNQ